MQSLVSSLGSRVQNHRPKRSARGLGARTRRRGKFLTLPLVFLQGPRRTDTQTDRESRGARAGHNRARKAAQAVPGGEAHRTKMSDVHAEQVSLTPRTRGARSARTSSPRGAARHARSWVTKCTSLFLRSAVASGVFPSSILTLSVVLSRRRRPVAHTRPNRVAAKYGVPARHAGLLRRVRR